MMPEADAAGLMDRMYRRQRFIYDLTRKPYLLGRDRLIKKLDPPLGGAVLEIACGTGRNLVAAALRHPAARFYGLDISREMLATAKAAIRARALEGRVRAEWGDATAFDAAALFGRDSFDRVFISYALSMIPDWPSAVARALDRVAPGGELHIVDFGGQRRLPTWFRRGLTAWLARFQVTPRAGLQAILAEAARDRHLTLRFETLYRGYADYAVLSRA